ncbi:MAG: hypothetical protein GY724_14740 [Actinomycetia bacterium]|nr:hypothetical protein [Actinomycetes bacterium]MCP4225734.1 hypothetical protein [Actinomycetes bacterium]MCP5030752.1 hypothetical protein [Actinomycetes bacterium]
MTPITTLVAWTLFVWVGRVRNIIDDETLTGWSRTWRLGFAISFVTLAMAVGGLAIRQLSANTSVPRSGRLVTALAIYSIVVWFIRGTDIVLGHHSAGFKMVHAVLAVVSIGLGALALRWVSAQANRPQ